MATFTMEDVPGEVWDSVYKKWDNALVHGWSSSLWFRCSLCKWLWQSRLYCDDCPLVADGWCNSSINSRLHRCHYGSDEDWRYEVRRFMEFIEPYCLEKHGVYIMNKFVTMNEVPPLVWDVVYEKWEKALKTGWQPEIWSRCALCEWLDIDNRACLSCPLNPTWCRAVPRASQLHITFNDGNEERWADAIRSFLKFIKPYCTHEIN